MLSEYEIVNVKVISGNAFKVTFINEEKQEQTANVKLRGVITDRVNVPNNVERLFGLHTKERIQDYFYDGNKSRTKYIFRMSEEKDIHGRIEADFKIEGDLRSLCAIIISEGYGVPFRNQSLDSIMTDLEANRERLLFEGKVKKEDLEYIQ